MADVLVTGVHVATLEGAATDLGLVHDAAVAVEGGRIVWVGPAASLPAGLADGADVVDGGGRWVTPGLVDCHTHAVFSGNRAAEFRARLEGASYEEIARAGGGILSTVQATRSASEEELLSAAAPRLKAMADRGVTTVEVKSGYGLDVETELRMLRVARGLGERTGLRVSTTLLGAHALPPEFAGQPDAYVSLVCDEMIPAAAADGLADAVDAFCEGIAFTPEECRRVLEAGRRHGLHARLHADQLSDLGGAALAAELGARSADHLEYTSREGARRMGRAGTVAVLLPGAYYFLRETQTPPVEAFREYGVAMAVATDLNPGSSPLLDPLLAMNLACVQFGFTPAEALAGMTTVAACVLGLEDELGRIAPGYRADLAFWDVGALDELAYWMGRNPCAGVMRGGIPPDLPG